MDGNFSIVLPQGKNSVKVSYMGMEDKTVTIKGNKIQIELRADQKTLDEVVVTGYGVQKKASFTGAASLLNGSQIEKKSDANFGMLGMSLF